VPRRGTRVRAAWLAVPAEVGLGDGEAEFLELGDELAQAAVVVEPGAVVGGLVIGQDAGGGLAVFLRFTGRRVVPQLYPADVPLPRERSKQPYGPAQIDGYLALADASPPAPATRRPSRLPGHDAECDADGPAKAIWDRLSGRGDVARCGAGPPGGRAGDSL
jgi:hypothetical protein